MIKNPIYALSGTLRKALLLAVLALVPVAGFAQETTSAIRGKVVDATGSVVAGASVEVVDERTGVSRSLTTNNTGSFYAAKLPVGGPYRVTVSGNKTVIVDFIGLGDTYNLTINLQQAAAVEEIVVIGQTAELVDVAAGPSATFSAADMETAISFDRDIKEVYSYDPRLNLDTDGFQMNCGGQHPRFNSVTLDGVSQNDRFGLNTNGYSTATGMPFPYDGIEQVVVELAPFDVTYSGFSACNINAVSRSGSNEWEFGGFYEYTSDDYRGDEVDGTPFVSDPFTEEKFGVNFGGPIIQDKLFIFAAYEEADFPRFLAQGYAGSGNGVERPWLSQADYDRIVNISNNVYGYDPGGLPGDGTQTNQTYMARVDWNITDKHNAAFVYNYFDGPQTRASDSDPNEFEFPNHYYVKGAEMETITAKINSQWTDAFSTELYFSTAKMTDSQVTVGPKDFADMQITLEDSSGRNTVYLGADDSRQANSLNYESQFIKLIGQYHVGDHVITAGYEQEELDVFNLFVQHSRGGEYDFFDSSFGTDPGCFAPGVTAQDRLDDTPGLGCEPSGIDRFELGRPSRIYYGSGGGTNVAADAAANFGNTLHSFYLQDEIFFDDLDLTIVAGFRYETFSSDDRPVFNQTFTAANGIPNNANIDGLDLIMPRFGFTWGGWRDDVELRGGVGLYAGGNPNVWLSNAWSNDGLTNAQFRNNYFDSATVLPGFADSLPLSGTGRPGYDVPQELVDAVAAVSPSDANDSGLVLIDPNYEQPAQWKIALGASWDMPWWDISADFDILHTRAVDTAYYVDVSQRIIGATSLNTPIYDYAIGEDNFMLTNSDEDGYSTLISAIFNKSFDWGLDMSFGYAHTRAKDVSPMTSFVASSNFTNLALLNINDPIPYTSNYVVPHRFTLRTSYAREFFGDNTTRFTLYGVAQEGQPISYVMDSSDLEGDGFNARHLLYVPDGPNDPNVVYDPGFDQAAFNSFIQAAGLTPGIQARNSVHAKWSTRFDLAVAQDIPLGTDDFKGRLMLKVYNLGNLLNSDWGKQYDAQFFPQEVVGASVLPSGQFLYESYNNTNINDLQEIRSLWKIRLIAQFDFN